MSDEVRLDPGTKKDHHGRTSKFASFIYLVAKYGLSEVVALATMKPTAIIAGILLRLVNAAPDIRSISMAVQQTEHSMFIRESNKVSEEQSTQANAKNCTDL